MIVSVRRLLDQKAIQLLFFSLCVGLFVAFGIVGIGRGAPPDGQFSYSSSQFDIHYCYAAGRAWFTGQNGYDPQITLQIGKKLGYHSTLGFGYPPHIAPLCTFLGIFPWGLAQKIMIALNVFCVGAIAYLSLHLIQQTETPGLKLPNSGAGWYIAGIIIGNPFTAKVVWLGQTSAIVGAALLGSWYFYRRERWVWSGILLAIATIKPQLSILIILWFILDRRWRILGVAVVSLFVLCLIPIAVSGPLHFLPDWFSALALYKEQPQGSVGWVGQAGLQNSIYLLSGLAVPNLLPLAIGFALVLWRFRDRFLLNDIFGVLPMLSLLFGYGHYYDAVVLSVLVPLFWRHLREQPQAKLLTLGLLSALCATFSHPLFDLPEVAFKGMLALRAFILLSLGIVLLVISHRRVLYTLKSESMAVE